MKQLLFLLLFPAYAMAQYPGNANQKITLGEQTTADGLVWRGIRADTTSKIVPFSDTSAYIILDTVEKTLWLYKAGQIPKWQQVGGSTLDTATMLLPYYRAGRNTIIQAADVPTLNQNTTGSAATLTTGRTVQTNLASTSAATFNGSANITPGVTGTLPVANGGTGASVKIFVDTFSNQTVNGLKTFKDSLYLGNAIIGKTKQNNNSIRFGINSGLSTADKSVAIGTNNLQNDSGGENVAIGFEAGKSVTTGTRNMLIGSQAGSALTSGLSNLAIGSTSLFLLISGYENVALGRASLEQSTAGNGNTAVGQATLYRTTGDFNTAIGYRAGWANSANNNTTGTNNTFIGNEAVGASATASNVITLGNSSIATIRAQVTTITSLSDMRDKTDILPLNYGMNLIDKLKPVSFVWDMRDGGKIGIPEIGFIAQDLQQAQIDLGINVPNLVSGVEEKLEASYGVLLPIIVKALQEANEKIKSLEQRLLILENK